MHSLWRCLEIYNSRTYFFFFFFFFLLYLKLREKKKVWINQGDIILVSLRDYQDEKADVILKYTADEARNLKTYGELPSDAKINETNIEEGDEEDIGFEFDNEVDIGKL